MEQGCRAGVVLHVGAKGKHTLGFWDTGISPSSSIREQLVVPIPGPASSKAEHQSLRPTRLVYTHPLGSTHAEQRVCQRPSNHQQRSHEHKQAGSTAPSLPSSCSGLMWAGSTIPSPDPQPTGSSNTQESLSPSQIHGWTLGHSPAPALGLPTIWFPTHRLVQPVFARRSHAHVHKQNRE